MTEITYMMIMMMVSQAVLTRKSIDEHRESRDPNHPRDYIDCYLEQEIKETIWQIFYTYSLPTCTCTPIVFSQMEHDKEFDQEGLEITCLDLFKVVIF